MRLEGKRALVTGAAQGIGAAIAKKFCDEGALVVGLDLVKSQHAQDCVVFDLAQVDQIAELPDQLGHFDILVNCAGICPTRPMESCDLPTWRKVFEVNVHAPFFLIQGFSKSMKEKKQGAIINLASISGFVGKLEQIDYGASKAALVSITRSTALALGPYNVRVNAIAPGVIKTPLTSHIAEERARIRNVSPDETLRPVIEATPLRRVGEDFEIADMAAFLASDESSYVTGQTFDVCGGFLMR